MGRFLHTATPLILLAIAGLVWFEKVLPGAGQVRQWLGDDGVLRFCLGVLSLYVLLLWADRLRMEAQFTRVLKTFKEFHEGRLSEGAQQAQARQEAARLLIGALGSDDPEVRQSSAQHLKRLTGQDFGQDRAAWNRWLETASGASEADRKA